jgi:hypothetical protein
MADKIARVAFIADVQGYVNGVDKAQKKTKGFQDGIGKMALPAALAFGAVTAAAIDFTKAAAEDEKAANILAGTLKNTTSATDAQIAATEQWITKTSMATAVADDQLRPALGKLATATGDITKAQDLMAIALNASAQTGKPLEATTTAIAKAQAGQLTALNKLVPGLIDGSDKTLTFADAMAKLDETTKGAAEAAADADPYAKMTIALNETKEAIGAGLLPIIQKFTPYLQAMATWAQENSDKIVILIGFIAGLAGSILAINGALKIYEGVMGAIKIATGLWSAAQAILNVVLTANPIGLVVIAIAALIAIFVVAYTKVGWFRDGVDAAFGAIKTVVSTVIGFIGEKVPEVFNNVIEFFKGLPDKFLSIGKTLINAITYPYREAFAWIARAWNATIGSLSFEFPSWAGPLGGKGFSVPKLPESIPALADGGIVTGPTLALIGEQGPEAVVPLNRMNGVTINISGALDPVGVARQIQQILGQANVRLGVA